MKTNRPGLDLIKEFEGCILYAYDDATEKMVKAGETARGTLTIGYGHTNAAGLPKVVPGQRITKVQAEEILKTDLGKVEKQVSDLVKVKINQNQFDALVSFHYNTGALGRSSALRLLNSGDYAGCADALTLYNRGNGQVLQGLVRRREAEKKLFLMPSSPTALEPVAVAAGATGLLAYLGHWEWAAVLSTIVLIGIGIYVYKRIKNV